MKRAIRKPHRFDRVYFFGAGASVPLGYPTGAQLPARIVQYLKSEKRNAYVSASKEALHLLSRMLSTYMGARVDLARLNTREVKSFFEEHKKRIDVATFYSVADTLSELPGEPELKTVFEHLAATTRNLMLKLVLRRDCVYERVPELKGLLLNIAKNRKRDAIVCFNWDEEIDFEFCDQQKIEVCYTREQWAYNERRRDPSILLLKPHGSIGWYDVINGLANEEPYFISEEDARVNGRRRIMSFLEFEMPRRLNDDLAKDAVLIPPIITSPTFVKRFEFEEQRLIWADIEEVCRDASEFVFVGYAMAPDDFLTLGALAKSLEQRRQKPRWLSIGRADNTFEENFGRCFGSVDRRRNLIDVTFEAIRPRTKDWTRRHATASSFVKQVDRKLQSQRDR